VDTVCFKPADSDKGLFQGLADYEAPGEADAKAAHQPLDLGAGGNGQNALSPKAF